MRPCSPLRTWRPARRTADIPDDGNRGSLSSRTALNGDNCRPRSSRPGNSQASCSSTLIGRRSSPVGGIAFGAGRCLLLGFGRLSSCLHGGILGDERTPAIGRRWVTGSERRQSVHSFSGPRTRFEFGVVGGRSTGRRLNISSSRQASGRIVERYEPRFGLYAPSVNSPSRTTTDRSRARLDVLGIRHVVGVRLLPAFLVIPLTRHSDLHRRSVGVFSSQLVSSLLPNSI